MPANGFGLIARALIAWLACSCAGTAQPPAPATAADTQSTARGEAVQEVKPDVFYLKDKEGELQPVLGFTLEDFERMLSGGAAKGRGTAPAQLSNRPHRSQGKSPSRPGGAGGQLQHFCRRQGLGARPFAAGRLRGARRGQVRGPGEHLFQYDDHGNEYVVWLAGRERRHISFR